MVKGKWLLALALPALLAVIVFCCFYVFSDYRTLSDWYRGLNNCFYRHQHWNEVFFTVNTKRHGNIFCICGIAVAIVLQYYLVKRLIAPGGVLYFEFSKWDVLLALICLLSGTAAWLWGYSLVHQGFDEVFSAVNCASLPPVQTLTYYMLPNNHILFNLLNSTLFHFAGDKVFTGKLISLVCYWGIIILVFAWLSGIIENRILLLVATIAVMLQFPVWGFGFQARGYELYTLAEWFAFFALLRYINTKNSQWLYYYVLACVTGYLCIPVFIYFHAAILVFGLLLMASAKGSVAGFWKVQLVILLIAFLGYLPAICFSGTSALAGNQYVSAQIQGLHQFYHKSLDMFAGYISFYTSNFSAHHYPVEWILFLLPTTLFSFYLNRLAVLCGFFYLAMWLTCIVLAYIMKIYPIDRTMSGQVSISLALTIYVLYLLLSKLSGVLKTRGIAQGALMTILAALGIYFTIANKANASFCLYNNDINLKYDLLMNQGINFIPRGSTIGFSDECFYWYYQCQLRGDKVSKCN